ncbi:hypothetical protein NSQ54_17210 [Alkalihalobacillus sp. FSL W8-0930]
MLVSITSAYVGSKCADFYESILSNNEERATIIQSEISVLIRDMEPDDKIISYFSLLMYRYNEVFKRSTLDIRRLKETNMLHPYLRYMYFFLRGQQDVIEEQYETAFQSFIKAEALLDRIPDEYEKEEFYLKVVELFYGMNQYVRAALYLERALDKLSMQDRQFEQLVRALLENVELLIEPNTQFKERYQAISQ